VLYAQECCGAIYEEELDALTDVVFDKFKDKRGLIPAAKAHEAARDLFKQYGGGLLPVSTSEHSLWVLSLASKNPATFMIVQLVM